jgi:hypothetical protein
MNKSQFNDLKITPLFLLLPVAYFMVTKKLFSFPKIFADELAAIDTLRFLQNGDFERFTAYRSGLGLMLFPFTVLDSDPSFLYRSQQLMNVIAYGLSMLLCFLGLAKIYDRKLVAFCTLFSFSFFPALYSLMRLTTETYLLLTFSIFLYVFTLGEKVKTYVKFIFIIILGLMSIVHARLFFSVTIVFLILIIQEAKSNQSWLRKLTFGTFTLLVLFFFQYINSVFSLPSSESNFLRNLLASDNFTIQDLSLIFVNKIALLAMESSGIIVLFFLISFLLFFKKKMHLNNDLNQSSRERPLIISSFLFLVLTCALASGFEYLLTLDSLYGESVQTISWQTRYVDGALPPIISLTILFALSNRKFVNSLNVPVVFFLLLFFSFIAIHFALSSKIVVNDPMRSPIGFDLSRGREINLNFLWLPILLMVIGYVFFFWKPFLLNLLVPCTLLFLPTSFGWEKGIRDSGWQGNHNLVNILEKQFEMNPQLKQCFSIEFGNPDSWWSQYSYRYWTKYPVSSVSRNCPYSLIDIPDGRKIIFVESQATYVYLVQNY